MKCLILSGAVILYVALLSSGCTYIEKDCDPCDCPDAAAPDPGASGDGDGTGGGNSGGSSGTAGGDGDGQGADAGQSGEDAGTRTDAVSPPGAKVEGEVCVTSDECSADLACVAVDTGMPNICARPCETDNDCPWEGEDCFSYSDRPMDAHCSALESNEYGRCGISRTTHCADPMICIQVEELWLGYCLTLCEIATGGANECNPDQACVESPLPSTEVGVCGDEMPRGADCELMLGIGCIAGDTCALDPDDPTAYFTCRQKCSSTDDTCDQGTTCVNWFPGDDTAYACF